MKNSIAKYLKPIFILLAAVFFFAHVGNAQVNHPKSIVSTKMVVLTYKHNDSSSLQDHTDTLNIPVVSDKYPGLKKALSFENIGDADGLQGVINNYASCSCGLTSLNYEVVFESNDINFKWDGTFKGKSPQPDVYVYQVEVFCDNGDIIRLNGNIALIL